MARAAVLSKPFYLLPSVFEPVDLPDTPQGFVPLPDCQATISGRAAALAVHGLLGMETVSYLTENHGKLFVNLVGMPGQGREATKSVDKMRGHTDGASLPLKSEVLNDEGEDEGDDDLWSYSAPSPDIVTLIGFRNPDAVRTNVMPLAQILQQLEDRDIEELKKPQYSIEAQFTFAKGMLELDRDVQVAVDVPLLVDSPNGLIVRFSHRNVIVTNEENGPAKLAKDNLQQACEHSVVGVVVSPGDVLLVSNRFCLHGRGVVGGVIGGNSRWLVRTYALDTEGLSDRRRYLGKHPRHVLIP